MTLTNTEKNEFFNENSATFGDRLEAARLTKGLTLQGLAEKVGVKKKTIQRWENDLSAPRANRIQMLAGMLNVSMIWLINGESNGTHNVVENYDRPEGINDALGEIAMLKDILSRSLKRLTELEKRLRDI
ncbi:MAG: helix-turn-helix transcriptional regulator [Rhodobacterales bacterium]